MRQAGMRTVGPVDQRGIALLTVMLLLMVLSVIGIAAITLTGLENRLAGFVRAGEASAVAAESCLGVAVTTINQAIANGGKVPAPLLDDATPPGPVPLATKGILDNEIRGVTSSSGVNYENYSDTVPATYPNFNIGIPTPTTTLNSFVVQGDIDRLYLKPGEGEAPLNAMGYEGAGAGGPSGMEVLYQVSCHAANSATNARTKITAIYACKPVSDGCMRKI